MRAKIYHYLFCMFQDVANYFFAKYIKHKRPTKALHMQMWGRIKRIKD